VAWDWDECDVEDEVAPVVSSIPDSGVVIWKLSRCILLHRIVEHMVLLEV
jgi:hypothetical protein